MKARSCYSSVQNSPDASISQREEQGDQSGDHPGDPRERRWCLDQEGSWKEVRSDQNLDPFWR